MPDAAVVSKETFSCVRGLEAHDDREWFTEVLDFVKHWISGGIRRRARIAHASLRPW